MLALTPVVWVWAFSASLDAIRWSQSLKSLLDRDFPLTDTAVPEVAEQAEATMPKTSTRAARTEGIERWRVTAESA